MGNETSLPFWKSHKVVRAAKIVDIEVLDDDNCVVNFITRGNVYGQVTTVKGWHERCKASEADEGYFVQYDDGYQSWSPSKAFEEGYDPCTETGEVIAPHDISEVE